jgi:glycosyltransferase involved in cell wall biosynthesis
VTSDRPVHRPIRVAFLTPTLQAGGAERQMLTIATALPREAFEVRFLVLSEGGPLAAEAEAAGIAVHILGLRQPDCVRSRLACLGGAARALRRYRRLTADVDIVDAWLVPAMAFAAFAQPLVRVPSVLGGRRNLGDIYRSKPWYRRLAASAAARRMDAIVANSNAAAAEVIANDRVPAARVRVIPNGVHPATATDSDRRRFRSAWGWGPDSLVVGCVANYKLGKGLGMLIEATDRLRYELPALRVVIVGEGPLRSALQDDINERGLESIIRLHGTEPDARRVYAAFDVAVQASLSEGLPNVILEAAAAGLPIVATAVGGTTEVLTGDHDGLLVPQGDTAALASAIRRVAVDAHLRDHLGRAARETAKSFSVDRLVGSTASLYRDMAAARRR